MNLATNERRGVLSSNAASCHALPCDLEKELRFCREASKALGDGDLLVVLQYVVERVAFELYGLVLVRDAKEHA